MIGKIKKGHRMIGLVQYLAGPGRANEHTDIHVVCSSELIATVSDGMELDAQSTMALGHEMNHPKKVYHPENSKRAQVFHVSLSLDPTQGVKDDDFWDTMVREYLHDMEMDGTDGKPPMRWTAIRHGVSSNGNDHVHIAVSMIREDGTWWNADKDFMRSSATLRTIEKKHCLRILGQGVKTRGYAEGELQSVARRRAMAKHTHEANQSAGMVPWSLLDRTSREHMITEQALVEQPRFEIALKVRAAGAGSRSEAEYVRRLRGNSLLVRPYFAKGGTGKVAGYSVAMRPTQGERPIWYGGGTLAKDLSLPALRAGWPVDSAVEAMPEWSAASKNRGFATPDRNAVSGVELRAYFNELDTYVKTLAGTNVNDPAQYAQIAREGAGLFSAWAVAAGEEGDRSAKELREAAALFARHAELAEKPVRAVTPPSAVYADLCTHQAIGMSRRAGAAAVVRAWANMGTKLGGAFAAKGWGQRSEALATDLRERLDTVHDAYRVINPLPSRSGTQGAGVSTVRLGARQVRVKSGVQLGSLESRLRAAGVDEKAIAARIFAEGQNKARPGQPDRNKSPQRPSDIGDNPRPKDRGPEKGI
ncbi:hypothetical protein AAFM46_16765 (plasmid) [Arthrobacter sp. TMP15]|uniref:relaxase/mobilization nuclease domain-containing protein n=1 Tax=Arthrobacter sp. TMP15 TaxID=3140789 RepID=UPI0031B9C556